MLHLGTNRPAGTPVESHQLQLITSTPQNSAEVLKSLKHNENTNSGKDHNSTSTTLYPHSELKEELSRTHYSIQIYHLKNVICSFYNQ